MFRKLALLLLLGASAQAAPPRALILYDGRTEPRAEGPLSARYIANLLGHFQVVSESKPVASYRKGDTEHYNYVFFAGNDAKAAIPKDFLDDVARTETDVIWLGRHIEKLVGRSASGKGAEQFGFSYIDYSDDGFEAVVYRNQRLPKGDPDLSMVAILDPQRVRVHATAVNYHGALYPYALQHNNFWYFADSPFSFANEGDRYLVFCDLLHDIFDEIGGARHAVSHRAMVRIEDVSVEDEPAQLKAVADYLYSQHVPFQIALIPIYRDPQRGIEIHLSDRPQFVEAVRYMVSRGGVVVLHGVTHQNTGVSADDYEFWNDLTDGPLPNDSADRLERKLELAFQECFANGIYPVSWETPHNAGSPLDYQTLGKYFTVFYERVLAESALASEQYFPYTVRDLYGRYVVPENLGYLKAGDANTEPIVDAARSMLTVRDGIATFYFHPFLKMEYLKQIVGGIRGLGYEFISLREFAPSVHFRNWRVEVAGRSGLPAVAPGISSDSGYVHRVVLGPGGAKLEDEVLPLSRATGPVPRAALVALEPAARPTPQPRRSLLARLVSRLRPAASQEPVASAPEMETPQAAILWNSSARGPEAVEQTAFENVLTTYGFAVERMELKKFLRAPHDHLLVIPAGAARQLQPAQQQGILAHLRDGHPVVLAGRSELAAKLGINFAGRQLAVSAVTDLNHPERFLRWAPEEKAERFDPPEEAVPLLLDVESRQTLAFGGQFEKGRYLFLATPLDARSPLGLTRYPYLAQYLEEVFHYRPRVVRPRLEVYFDPGFRQNSDLDRLANAWRKSGVRTVHVAAWQFYPKYSFNYRRLIDVCHRQGIAAYAWFELPMVTKKFWDQHPEWREKTATGEDAQVGWRYLMNLYNPLARREALDFVRDLVLNEDWDGVNVAELNFDASDPLTNPAKYVPMNQDVRQEFRRARGFDPVDLFNPASPNYWQRNPGAWKSFTDFRVEIITSLHREILEELERVRRQKDLEIVITMIDSLHSPRIREHIGVDSLQIVKLMDRYRFTLQVEDPSEFWASSPDRYREFGKTYTKLVPDPSRLMFDVNIVPDRNVSSTDLPSQLATGTELARLLHSAAAPTGRAALYSEWTVTPQDWVWNGAVLASAARVTYDRRTGGWEVAAPYAVAVRVPAETKTFYLDGHIWPVFELGSVLVPAGRHLLTFSRPRPAWLSSWMDLEQLELRMRSLSGELLDAFATRRGMQFEYESPGRCVAVFNKQPYHVRVDGREWDAVPLFARGEWSLILPSGRHRAEIVANEPAVFVLEAASVVSSSLIMAFGTVSCGAMVGLYTLVRLQRAARRLRRRTPRRV